MDIDTLVFSSGANRGIMLAGAISCLEQLDMMPSIHTYVGTSIGALFASMCAIGMDGRQIFNTTMATNIKDSILVGEIEISNLYLKGFMHSNTTREKLISKILDTGGKTRGMTLRELYDTKKRTLIITACCLNTGRTEYMSYINYPHMCIARAVCISMTIPFMFRAYTIDDFTYVDGAAFGHSMPTDFKHSSSSTLGFILRGPERPLIIDGLKDVALALYDGRAPKVDPLQHTVALVSNVGYMDSTVSDKKKHEIIRIGFDTTMRYIHEHQSNTVKRNY